MNWDDSQLASSAFAKGCGGMSLGQQWGLAALLRGGDSGAARSDTKNVEKIKEIEENTAALAYCDEKYRQEFAEQEEKAYCRLFNELGIVDEEQKDLARQFIESLGVDVNQL